MNQQTRRKPSIGIVVISAIPDDPRVRRQGDLFAQAGWDVKGFGLPGGRSRAPDWPVFHGRPADPPPQAAPAAATVPTEPSPAPASISAGAIIARKARTALAMLRQSGVRPIARRVLSRVVRTLPRPVHEGALHHLRTLRNITVARVAPSRTDPIYWQLNSVFADLYREASLHRCEVWLANDWSALPIAARLAAEQNAVLLYDTHELASDEYPERWRWRMFHKPLVMAIEGSSIRKAARVTCVSDGIADRLRVNYRLSERPLVIRNTPVYQAMPFRPTGERIEVLYHGVVSPGRGLEDCIRAAALMRPEFHLTIRGPVSDEYRAHLGRCIAEAEAQARVTLAPPVAMIDLVAEANRFDIGLFALPGHSRHNVYALPNKLFEYTMAGLCVVVSDLPEMAAIVNRYGIGPMIAAVDPASIAEAVNRLDRATIDACKKKALEAARDLNWEVEGARHVEAADLALKQAQARVAA